MRKIAAILAVISLFAVIASNASAMRGQMKGQAAITGSLDNQTITVSGSVFFGANEDDAVVCLTATQNGHKARGCSPTLSYSASEVMFGATLTGSGFVPGKSALRAVVTYDYYSGAGEQEKTWTWNNNGFMLVAG